MAKVFSENIVISIDIGTTKICVLVARKNNDGSIEILGVGKSPSYGLRKGIVIDINKTVESIKTAVKEAELVSGHTIESAIIGVSGNHIKSFNSYGAVPIKKREVQNLTLPMSLKQRKHSQFLRGNRFYMHYHNTSRLMVTTKFCIQLAWQAYVLKHKFTS